MKNLHLSLFILNLAVTSFNFSAATVDPCQIAKVLPNFDLRLKVFKINPMNGDTPMCDRYFINEPGEWFRTVGGIEMVNNRTSYFECGTQYSIYMQGKYFSKFKLLFVLFNI